VTQVVAVWREPPDDAVIAQPTVEVGGVESNPGVGGPRSGLAPEVVECGAVGSGDRGGVHDQTVTSSNVLQLNRIGQLIATASRRR
jgi:hypothetical protein